MLDPLETSLEREILGGVNNGGCMLEPYVYNHKYMVLVG